MFRVSRPSLTACAAFTVTGMTAELLADQVTRVVERASTAPSIHNTQPWGFRSDGHVIEVWADRRRQLNGIDPTGRQLTVSIGIAVEFAVIALRAEGFEVGCSVLPEPDRPDLVARLTPLRPKTVEGVTRALVHCMPRRSTYRQAFDGRRVPEEVLRPLRDVIHSAGCGSLQVRPEQQAPLVVLMQRAEESELAEPTYRDELHRWRAHASDVSEGIPDSALPHSNGRVSRVPLRRFDLDRPSRPPVTPAVDDPELLLITTEGDEPHDWVAAGRALGRLLLHAVAAGLQASPVTQSLDSELDRARTAALLGVIGHPQILLRLGYGTSATTAQPTPRRPVNETLRFVSTA
jgi:hypothetical protein